MGIEDIITAKGTKAIVVRECMDVVLIGSTARSATCIRDMSLNKDGKTSDGFRWLCVRCKGLKGIRSESFFKDSNVPFISWMKFVKEWAN